MLHRLLTSLQSVFNPAVRHRPGGPRSQIADRGRTALCRRKTFTRWSQHDRRGWTLRGKFYGARGQFLGKQFSLSEGDLARGVVVLGWHATQSVLFPAIADRMRDGHSLVVTDLSGILQCHIQSVAATTGHLILVHNLDLPAISCALNPCDWIDNVDGARAVAAILLLSAHRRAPTGGVRRIRQAIDLLAACALHYQSFSEVLDARQDLARLIRELTRSQAPGVAELAASFRAPVLSEAEGMAKDLNLAHSVALTAFDIGLAPWANAAIRQIGGHSDLDLPAQLTGLPTVIILRCARRRVGIDSPYLEALLYALATRLAEATSAGSLPVGLILENLADLGRLDTLVRATSGRVPILAAAESIVQFDRFYPAREEAERTLAGLATQIVFGGCDQPTAEFVSRLGGGLLLPEDVTRLARDHAIVFAPGGDGDRAARVIFHGVPTPLSKREDWKLGQAQPRSITVIPRPPNARSTLASANGRPEPPSGRAEPSGGKTKRRAPTYDAIERLLADAPESPKAKDQDLWTNENW
jgi:hypothetical protein